MSLINPLYGYTPTGVGSPYQSEFLVGKDLTLQWEAIGFGPNGRPDLVENVRFNLTLISGTQGQAGTGPMQVASLSFAAADIAGIVANATTLQSPVALQLTEVIICNNGNSGRMIVLGSAPYN